MDFGASTNSSPVDEGQSDKIPRFRYDGGWVIRGLALASLFQTPEEPSAGLCNELSVADVTINKVMFDIYFSIDPYVYNKSLLYVSYIHF